MPNNLDANWKAPSNRIVEEALSDPYAESQELQAYISKKNTRGYFQSRYFVTQGRKLSYYNDENIYTEEQKLIYADKDFNSTATEYCHLVYQSRYKRYQIYRRSSGGIRPWRHRGR